MSPYLLTPQYVEGELAWRLLQGSGARSGGGSVYRVEIDVEITQPLAGVLDGRGFGSGGW